MGWGRAGSIFGETAAQRAAREAGQRAARERAATRVSQLGGDVADAANNAPLTLNIVNRGASASRFSKFTNAVKSTAVVGAVTGGAVLTANLLEDAEQQKGECKEVCSAGQLPLEGVEPTEDGTTTKMQCNQWLDESNEATDQEKLTECCNSFCDDKYKASAVIGQELGEMGAVAGNVAADVGGGVGSGLAEGLTGGEAPDLLGIGDFGDQLKMLLVVGCVLLLITNVIIPMIAALKGGK
jgi:hypothetical protein